MNDAPKYKPTDDEPRLIAWAWPDPRGYVSHGVMLCGEIDCGDRESAEAEVQRAAIAIADRVHGAELAALRAEVERLRTALHDLDHAVSIGAALIAAEAMVDGSKPAPVERDWDAELRAIAGDGARWIDSTEDDRRDEDAAWGWIAHVDKGPCIYSHDDAERLEAHYLRSQWPSVAILVDERNAARKDGA